MVKHDSYYGTIKVHLLERDNNEFYQTVKTKFV